jgi:hypothetical protein
MEPLTTGEDYEEESSERETDKVLTKISTTRQPCSKDLPRIVDLPKLLEVSAATRGEARAVL